MSGKRDALLPGPPAVCCRHAESGQEPLAGDGGENGGRHETGIGVWVMVRVGSFNLNNLFSRFNFATEVDQLPDPVNIQLLA